MQLQRHDFGKAVLITVDEARIDAAVAIQFKDRLRELAADSPVRVVLDMQRVGFLDSSGLGAMVAAMKQLGSERRLELAALSTTVQKVFRLTRMDTVFKIHDSVEEALAGLSNVA